MLAADAAVANHCHSGTADDDDPERCPTEIGGGQFAVVSSAIFGMDDLDGTEQQNDSAGGD
jgi:hypothetical protein